jgi:hypothetical protein
MFVSLSFMSTSYSLLLLKVYSFQFDDAPEVLIIHKALMDPIAKYTCSHPIDLWLTTKTRHCSRPLDARHKVFKMRVAGFAPSSSSDAVVMVLKRFECTNDPAK